MSTFSVVNQKSVEAITEAISAYKANMQKVIEALSKLLRIEDSKVKQHFREQVIEKMRKMKILAHYE